VKPAEVALGVYRLMLPLPGLELGHVNVYAIPGPDGVRLVDTGFDHPEVRTELEDQLSEIGARLEDVREAFVTHIHSDHAGLADWLVERAGATVYIWAGPRGDLRPFLADRWQRATDWMLRNGMPDDGFLRGRPPIVLLERAFTKVEPAHVFAWGGRELEVVTAPGHAPQLACLLDRGTGLFFSTDHVLPRITPHVGSFSEQDDHSLADYLESLASVLELPVRLALPGHGDPFPEVYARTRVLSRHHEVRMDEIGDLLSATGVASAYGLAERMAWLDSVDGWSRLDTMNRMMAVSETLAHLRHLEAGGRVRMHVDGDRSVAWELVT
jgi:glyoxylase-like metal-dependent hydrolase (beta-lactamase superfamily II)